MFANDGERMEYAIQQIIEKNYCAHSTGVYVSHVSPEYREARHIVTRDTSFARWLYGHGAQLVAFDSAHITLLIDCSMQDPPRTPAR